MGTHRPREGQALNTQQPNGARAAMAGEGAEGTPKVTWLPRGLEAQPEPQLLSSIPRLWRMTAGTAEVKAGRRPGGGHFCKNIQKKKMPGRGPKSMPT